MTDSCSRLMMRKKPNHLNKKRSTFITPLQTIYLTVFFFIRNNLTVCASACSFGLLFSFIPIAMMIFTVLISFLHASPEVLTKIIEITSQYKDLINVEQILITLRQINGRGTFEIIIGISIFWMARRFFASVMDCMSRIFHRAKHVRPILSQVLIFGGEVLLVVVIAIIMLVVLSAQTIFSFPILNSLQIISPTLFSEVTQTSITRLPYFLAIFFITLVYRVGAGTKPAYKTCFFSATACMVVYWCAVKILGIFLNVNRYNLVYGVLSHLIVTLVEVFAFFTIFLLFAELVYVCQYFDLLLLGELYLLPEKTEKGIIANLKRKLFISPRYLMKNKDLILHFRTGEHIFKENDVADEVYYIASGHIQLTRKGVITLRGPGEFLGETSCVLNRPRTGIAVALADSEIVRISSATFKDLIEQDSRITVKVLSRASDYFNEVYGRKSTFLL